MRNPVILTDEALKKSIPFLTTYTYETGLSTTTATIKNKLRNRLVTDHEHEFNQIYRTSVSKLKNIHVVNIMFT